MKKLFVVLLALVLCLASAAMADTPSVLTQEQYDLVDAWFGQVWETIPGKDHGQTISGSKFIVAMKEPGTGVYTSLPDDGLKLDMSVFPQEHLAASYEEADTLIMIYPVYKVTGQYLGMAIPVSARRTYTTVCAVDLTTGTVGSPFSAVVRDAPKSVRIETRNGIPLKNAISGSFEPQMALETIKDRLVISEPAAAVLVDSTGIPPELVGKWSGTGIPKNGGTNIDLAVTIQADGTGSYTFIQGRYLEDYPFSLSATDHTFSVAVPETAQFSRVEGDWTLKDGRLLLDIATIFPNGRIYSYTAVCSRTEAPAEDAATPAADQADPSAEEVRPGAETGDEAKYREACGLYDQALYYSASAAFRESQYGDWAERAAACIQPWPRNGEVWRNYRIPVVGMQLTIQVNQPEDSAFFARIYLDGEAYTGLLIRGADAVTVDLPGGVYAIKAGTGDVWYGGREAFGKDGHYQAMTFDDAGSETTRLEVGYSYTLSINVDTVTQGTGVGNRSESWENFAE